ncbi:MAG: ribosome small subunit-dependent GTPase A [Acidimicrobiia bacterium]
METSMSVLVALGWNEQVSETYDKFSSGEQTPGRVQRVDRGSVLVSTVEGTVRMNDARRDPPPGSETGPPATGDWVVTGSDPDLGAVFVVILPRSTAISRRDPANDGSGRVAQVLAANIDRVFIVHGLDRPPQPGRLERSLVVAWDSGAEPTLVLTKTDLVDPEIATNVKKDLESLTPGVEVIAVSNKTGAGFAQLAPLLVPGSTVALLGASGTGKSSLVNRLVGVDAQATGDTRRGDGKGRHTTTTRDLITLSSGAVLIDTPGLREIGLWDSREGLDVAFRDISNLALGCRFRDCDHSAEPGCAVVAAVENGTLDERRLASYRSLKVEVSAAEGLVRRKRATRGRRRDAPQLDREDW